jgi:DNA-binding MarR family transcriptional regulator
MALRRYEGDREAAWTGFVQAQARLMQRLGQELDDAGKVPLSTYDVLVQLAENGGRLRLRDLVDRVVLSQPGLSRKVARMEDEGLVERLPDPNDGRGVLVRISRAGRAALRTASVVHISGIEREFTSRITDDEAATLARVFARLLAGEDLPDDIVPRFSAGDGGPVGGGTEPRAATTGRRSGGRAASRRGGSRGASTAGG